MTVYVITDLYHNANWPRVFKTLAQARDGVKDYYKEINDDSTLKFQYEKISSKSHLVKVLILNILIAKWYIVRTELE